MVEPVSLECNHRFCWPCIKHSKSVKSVCPMCRIDIKMLEIDQKYQAYIKESFAPDFKKQKEILKKNGKLFEDIYDFDLEIGNHYRLVTKGFTKTPDGARNNQHWTAYVRCTDPMKKINHLIEKVVFKFDPEIVPKPHLVTIVPGKVEPKGSAAPVPFARKDEISHSRYSWGVFEMTITIHWKKELNRKASVI